MSKVRSIPFFNYQFFHQAYGNELMTVLENVVKKGAYILQQDLADFERQFAQYLGVKYAIGVGNCTDGLYLALHAANIGPGDEVILPSHTFVASAEAVHNMGATPVLVECGRDHLIDVKAIEKAITTKTKVIMPVQLNGRTCNMDEIQSISSKHNLLIVEDAAQGLGSTFKGKKAGSFGLSAAFSFYPAKILGCLGDGGMVVTNDDAVAHHVQVMRDHGRNHDGDIELWGTNSRLDNIQAAVLSFFLNMFDQVIEKRRHIAAMYQERLQDLNELVLPLPPTTNTDHFDVFQNYEIEAEKRDALRAYLKENGIGSILQWGGKTVHQFKTLGFNVELPFTERMISRSLLIPMNLSVTDEDVEYVCDYIRKFYRG